MQLCPWRYPAYRVGENKTVTLNRVWVKATINNTEYIFDPG
jgi:hypothetical protein